MRARVGGLTVLLALAVVDTLAWRAGVARLESGTARWMADATRHGWAVSRGTARAGGWPFAATLAIATPAIDGGARLVPGGLAWSADRLVLSVSLLHPAVLTVTAEGQSHLRLSHLPDLVFSGQTMEAAIRLWGTQPAVAELRARGLSGGIAGSRHPRDVQVTSLTMRLTGLTDGGAAGSLPSAGLNVRADGIGLPDIGRWPLGAIIHTLSGTLILTSPKAGSDHAEAVPTAPAPLHAEDQARAWRDGGGRLVAQDIHLRWGPVALTAAATLALDDRLQPAGTGSMDITGSQAGLAALGQAGVITPGLAATGSAVLTLMARAPDDPAALRLPFELREATVLVGRIPVVHLHDVVWQAR